MFTHGRLRPTIGALLALAGIVAAMVVVTAGLCTVVSVSLATIETQPLTMPSAGALLLSAGAAYLVFMMWGTIGFALGTYARSAALSVGLGLVWTVVVENLLRGVGSALQLVEDVTAFLSGTAAGSLVGAVTGGGHTRGGGCDLGTEGAHHRRRLHCRRSGRHRDSGAEPGRELTAKILPVG